MEKIRLSKLMSERGLCSRREADRYIESGWVFVDGVQISTLGSRISPAQKITLHKNAQIDQNQLITILLNKPVGYVSGQAESGYVPAIQLIKPENQFSENSSGRQFKKIHLKNLAPAGRLDIDSQGLLVLTQDGRIAKQLIGSKSSIEKEYLVRVKGILPADKMALLNHGLSIDNKALKPARVEWLNKDQLRFVLHEGKKRQIRRMCEMVGLQVTGLKRVRIGKVRLGSLPEGRWRYLNAGEKF